LAKHEANDRELTAWHIESCSADSDLETLICVRNQLVEELNRLTHAGRAEVRSRIDLLNERISTAKEAGHYSAQEPTVRFYELEPFLRDRQFVRRFDRLECFALRAERLRGNQTGERLLAVLAQCEVPPVHQYNADFVCIPDIRFGPVVDCLSIVEATRDVRAWLKSEEERRERERLADEQANRAKHEAQRQKLLAALAPIELTAQQEA
jgi:hypothetical protein